MCIFGCLHSGFRELASSRGAAETLFGDFMTSEVYTHTFRSKKVNAIVYLIWQSPGECCPGRQFTWDE